MAKRRRKQRKYGLKIEQIKPQDYVFGGVLSAPYEVLQEDANWADFLPVEEAQNLNGIEPYACVAFTILNCIEMLIKRKYGEERNYSDRFLAAISGTKEGGNSPQTVAEFLRKAGVVKEEEWPFSLDINTFDKFYAPLPPKLLELARKFNEEWDFKHDYVPSTLEAIGKALKSSPLGISVAAWHRKGGIYVKPAGLVDNHFTVLYALGENKEIFDSYDHFLKEYDIDAKHSVIKRFYITKKAKGPWWKRFINWLLTP